MNIKLEAQVAMTYDLMNDDANSVVTLANSSAYSVNGEALDHFSMEFGAGVKPQKLVIILNFHLVMIANSVRITKTTLD